MRCTLTRRVYLAGILTAAAVGLTGCGLSGGVLTDTGTDVALQPDLSEYLDLSALSEEAGEEGWNSYGTYTVTYGTFSTQMAALRASVRMLETSCVKAQYSTGTMRLVEVLVEKNQYITAGTPVALVSMETDELDLQELERKLLRLQQRYEEEQEEFQESQEKREALFARWDPQRSIDLIEYNQAQLDFEQTAASYEKQIAALQEQISDLKELAGQTEILAEQDGYVLEVPIRQKGETLENGAVIMKLAPADKICLEFTDMTQHYGYGNAVTLLVGDTRTAKSYDAAVVSAVGKTLGSQWDVSVSRLTGDYAIAELLGNGPFYVTGETNVMENVLLVPAEAVTVENQKYYVTVVREDGSLTRTQFIPGGSNTEYYWVFDGLKEGTRVMMP